MWTRARSPTGAATVYGFGWAIARWTDTGSSTTADHFPASSPTCSRFPDDSLTVIVLTNADGARPDEVGDGWRARYLPER